MITSTISALTVVISARVSISVRQGRGQGNGIVRSRGIDKDIKRRISKLAATSAEMTRAIARTRYGTNKGGGTDNGKGDDEGKGIKMLISMDINISKDVEGEKKRSKGGKYKGITRTRELAIASAGASGK